MEIFKKYLNWFLVLLIIIFFIFIFKQIFPGRNAGTLHNIYKKDTNVQARYESEVKRDTVIKWYEKIIYNKSEPEKIYYLKTDTIFIEKIKDLDLMLHIKKENRKLIIKAVNQNGKLLKEYIYEDVNNDFTAVSQKENIFVKSKKIYWNRFSSIFSIQWSMLNEKRLNYAIGMETGLNYENTIDLNAGLLYLPQNKDLLINTNLKIKF